MSKRILGIRIKNIFIGILLIIALIVSAVQINSNRLAKWKPTEEMVGTWVGNTEIIADFKKDESPSSNPEDWFLLTIIIHPDGRVTGTMGDAVLEDCKINLNRNDFERAINVKTDYIISEGYLNGSICVDDSVDIREISFPFNIKENEIVGSIFHIEGMKYPEPLFVNTNLVQEE